jgi:hypothetical protein
VAQDDPRAADNAGYRVPIPEAERRESLTQLVLCRSKLSAREALRHQLSPGAPERDRHGHPE